MIDVGPAPTISKFVLVAGIVRSSVYKPPATLMTVAAPLPTARNVNRHTNKTASTAWLNLVFIVLSFVFFCTSLFFFDTHSVLTLNQRALSIAFWILARALTLKTLPVPVLSVAVPPITSVSVVILNVLLLIAIAVTVPVPLAAPSRRALKPQLLKVLPVTETVAMKTSGATTPKIVRI